MYRIFLRIFNPKKLCEKEGCNFKINLKRKKLVKSHSSFEVARKETEVNYKCPRCNSKKYNKWENVHSQSIQSLSLPGSMQEILDEKGEVVID